LYFLLFQHNEFFVDDEFIHAQAFDGQFVNFERFDFGFADEQFANCQLPDGDDCQRANRLRPMA